jgi:hypothetical protein
MTTTAAEPSRRSPKLAACERASLWRHQVGPFSSDRCAGIAPGRSCGISRISLQAGARACIHAGHMGTHSSHVRE